MPIDRGELKLMNLMTKTTRATAGSFLSAPMRGLLLKLCHKLKTAEAEGEGNEGERASC